MGDLARIVADVQSIVANAQRQIEMTRVCTELMELAQETILILWARNDALEAQLASGVEARRERARHRAEVAHGIIVSRGLPTATANDWRIIHEAMQVEAAEELLRKPLPSGATRDTMPPGQLVAEYYVTPRQLRKGYFDWLADEH